MMASALVFYGLCLLVFCLFGAITEKLLFRDGEDDGRPILTPEEDR